MYENQVKAAQLLARETNINRHMQKFTCRQCAFWGESLLLLTCLQYTQKKLHDILGQLFIVAVYANLCLMFA